jgi:hypothetical protein
MLGEFIADCLANFDVRLSGEIVGLCKPFRSSTAPLLAEAIPIQARQLTE